MVEAPQKLIEASQEPTIAPSQTSSSHHKSSSSSSEESSSERRARFRSLIDIYEKKRSNEEYIKKEEEEEEAMGTIVEVLEDMELEVDVERAQVVMEEINFHMLQNEENDDNDEEDEVAPITIEKDSIREMLNALIATTFGTTVSAEKSLTTK
ncbi:hypothetical protein F0562_030829 [Nyssa sinensis]|uniref:Uncharacterized protein n=1 Tax=Nyssa sinensis TaxID=561372 RepID=A0A5J5B409_9ASTE|nr:hypothetical protein F0562_030829 [Nyssa sinensis]